MARILYGLEVSPWTERARWALEHHELAYTYHEHVPMLGEVLLRAKARVMKATVPLLEDGETIVMGSVPIARHADRAGKGSKLFPEGRDEEIDRWVDVADRMANVGRAWFMKRVQGDREAQAEALPSFIPGGLRGMFAPSAGLAIRFLAQKHRVPTDVERVVDDTLRPALGEIRVALQRHRDGEGRATYLLGPQGFSVVDLVIAATLQVVRPHAKAKLGPRSREVWTNEALASDFADVLEWRDGVYERHR